VGERGDRRLPLDEGVQGRTEHPRSEDPSSRECGERAPLPDLLRQDGGSTMKYTIYELLLWAVLIGGTAALLLWAWFA